MVIQKCNKSAPSLTQAVDLKRQKGLINRISTDSVLNWDSINMILDFTKDYSK
jgi:hypothetical protein